jgi:hypothetical protein
MYLATLIWPMSMSSLRSSPWILGAPHNGFAMLITWINRRISDGAAGRPQRCRDLVTPNLGPAATSAQSAVGQDNSRAAAEYRNCLAANPSRVSTCDGLHHIMDADAQVLSGSALPQQNSADTTQGR